MIRQRFRTQAFSKELEALENLQHQQAEAELQLYAQHGSWDQSTQQLDPSGWDDFWRKLRGLEAM